MRNKLKLIAGIICLGVSVSSALAVGGSLLTPAYVLGEVAKSSATIKCFSAELYQSSLAVSSSTNLGSACFYFQTNYPDGRIEFRVEVLDVNKWGQTNSTITIQNGDGIWLLVKGKAIKTEFLGAELAAFNQSLASMPPPDKDRMKATVAEVTFNDIPCYLLTESVDTTLTDSTETFLKYSSFFKDSSIDLDKVFPVKRQYYVGTNDFFVYSMQAFNKNNLKISELTFLNVTQNSSLPQNAFIVPKGIPIIIVHSLKEYIDTLVNIYSGASSQIINKPPSAVARYTVLIFAIGSALFTLFVLFKDTADRKTEQTK